MMLLFAFLLFMGWPLGFVEPYEYQCFCFLKRMRLNWGHFKGLNGIFAILAS